MTMARGGNEQSAAIMGEQIWPLLQDLLSR
jgi:hypothetical protein